MGRACHIVAAVLALAPFTASGKPIGAFRFVVTDAGDQTDPSIDGALVIYSGPGPAGSGTDVLLYDASTRATRTLAGGPGEQHAPDLQGDAAIFLDQDGVAIRDLGGLPPDDAWRTPAGDGEVAAPAIGPEVAAWEVGRPGARDIRVSRYRDGVEGTLGAPGGGAPTGDQFAPAVFGPLVGYVDGQDGGAAWLHDVSDGSFTRVCDGSVSGLSVGKEGERVVVAVARATAGDDEDVEVHDTEGHVLAALRVPGVQRNPHLSGEWVAFEDVSTSLPQVVVWKWTATDLVFVPHPTRTAQVLNDLSFAWPEVRVVFEDTATPESGRDIALYALTVHPEIQFDDEDDGFPVSDPEDPEDPGDPEPGDDPCDPSAAALATLSLSRGTDAPEAGRVDFEVAPPDGAAALPVLVCIEAQRVSAAWVALDDVAVASPSDFEPSVVSLARPASLAAGPARLSGVIAGKPGSWLRARVVADPSRPPPAAAPAEPTPSARRAAFAAHGCGTGAGAGLLSLLALLLLPTRARRRA